MTLALTPDILRAAYDYLNETPPFSRWNLPLGEDVIFRVIKRKNDRGIYWYERKKHHIGVSSRCIARTQSLMEIVAHEMIHLHERHAKACGTGEHSAAFNKWAEQVCRIHGFDPKLF